MSRGRIYSNKRANHVTKMTGPFIVYNLTQLKSGLKYGEIDLIGIKQKLKKINEKLIR